MLYEVITVRCAGAADIRNAIAFARDHDLLLAIRGAGHNIAGNAVCDDGLMIDLSQMRSVRIDPGARRAYVEPGAILGDLDHEAQAFGLVTPLGINSTTGVAGRITSYNVCYTKLLRTGLFMLSFGRL